MPSFQLTYYYLFLGGQDSVTGWYRKGYVIMSIKGAVVQPSSVPAYASAGTLSRAEAILLTNYDVEEGGIVLDSFENYWLLLDRLPHTIGNKFVMYKCPLKKLMNFPFIAGFFGFEDEDHGYLGCEFETGFERGYFAL